MKNDTEEGVVDLNFSVVFDEAESPELIHEEVDPGPRCADHLRQDFLGHFRNNFLRLVFSSISSEQQ